MPRVDARAASTTSNGGGCASPSLTATQAAEDCCQSGPSSCANGPTRARRRARKKTLALLSPDPLILSTRAYALALHGYKLKAVQRAEDLDGASYDLLIWEHAISGDMAARPHLHWPRHTPAIEALALIRLALA